MIALDLTLLYHVWHNLGSILKLDAESDGRIGEVVGLVLDGAHRCLLRHVLLALK